MGDGMTLLLLIIGVGCLALTLSACTGQAFVTRAIDQQTPLVAAGNGGSAELEILACPHPDNAIITQQSIDKLLNTLNTAGLLVTAENGSAKLIINLCAGG
jgi:hypothetical protein